MLASLTRALSLRAGNDKLSFSVKSKIVLKEPDSIWKPRNHAKKSRSLGDNLNGEKFVLNYRVCDITQMFEKFCTTAEIFIDLL